MSSPADIDDAVGNAIATVLMIRTRPHSSRHASDIARSAKRIVHGAVYPRHGNHRLIDRNIGRQLMDELVGTAPVPEPNSDSAMVELAGVVKQIIYRANYG